MALKGFEKREVGFQGLPKSRYEEAIKVRKAAAERMIAEAEKTGKGAATMAAKWIPRIAGTVIGAYAGQPMAGYAAGSAVGDVAAGVVQEDPDAIMAGLAQAPGAVAGGMKVAEGFEGASAVTPALSGKPSLGDYASQLEVDPDLAPSVTAGADILKTMDPRMKEIYDLLPPERQAELLRNLAFSQATTEGFSLPGFAGTK